MKCALMTIADKILVRIRAIIVTVDDELKNMAHIEHSKCYQSYQEKRPSHLGLAVTDRVGLKDRHRHFYCTKFSR